MKKARPITSVDRMLAWSDGFEDAIGEPRRARRRTHRRFGKLDVVVVETTGEPTVVYLTNEEDVIVEARPKELLDAADAVRDLLANPPPIKRKARR